MALLPAHRAAAASDAPGLDRWLNYEARLTTRLGDAGGGRFDAATASQLLSLTNKERSSAGAGLCAWDEDLAAAARAHAADLAQRNYVEHLSPEGFDPSHRISLIARRWIGSASENIAWRRNALPSTAASLMQVWRESRPHWTNLLAPSHERAGFGVVVIGQQTYAVGLYGRRDGELSQRLPFRLYAPQELTAALADAPPEFLDFNLSDPVDGRRRLAAFGRGETPSLAPGVYQLGPRRLRGAGPWILVLLGPIFVKL